MKVEWKSCFRIGITVIIVHICVTHWTTFTDLLSTVVGAAMPLLIGCVIAYAVNILMSFYEKYYFPNTKRTGVVKSRRPVCILAAFLSVVLLVVLLMKIVIPELMDCVELLLIQIPDMKDRLVDFLEEIEIVPEDMIAGIQNTDWRSKIEQSIPVLKNGVGNMMGTVVDMISSAFSGIVTIFFAFIFSIYLLMGKEKIAVQFDRLMKRYMKEKIYSKTKHVLSVVNDSFHNYIVGQCTEAVILGTLCAVGMVILNFPYAAVTGAVIAFTALIPIAGAYIGAAIGAIMIMTVSPIQAILFLIYLVILQQLEEALIYPRVVGSSIGLPAIWVLAAVIIGGGVMGIAGMLVGVPLAAALYRLLREDM